MKSLAALLTALLLAAPAYANKQRAEPATPECAMQSQVSLSISYDLKASTFAEAHKRVTEQNAKIAQMAEQQKLSGFKLQGENSNISSQPSNYTPDGQPTSFTYQVNGSLSYTLDNPDEAIRFAEYLSGQKLQVSVSTNSYRNC